VLEIKTVRIVKRESQLRQKDKTTRRPADESDLTPVGEGTQSECGDRSTEDVVAEDAVLSQFRRTLSLPRGYDRRAKPSADAISRIPNFRHHMLKRLVDRSPSQERLSAHEQLFGSSASLHEEGQSGAAGGEAGSGADSPEAGAAVPQSPDRRAAQSPEKEAPLSPVFKSDAARRIVEELQTPEPERKQSAEQYRRAQPRPKRRHVTISSSRPIEHEAASPPRLYGRASDDMALGRASSTPDVVKSSLTRVDPRFDANTIDTLLGTPQKIHIPERYVPELEVEPVSAEERLQRSRKAASIRRMLTQSTGFLDTVGASSAGEQAGSPRDSAVSEKMQRAHILQLNEILARQVTEKSKRVAVSTTVH